LLSFVRAELSTIMDLQLGAHNSIISAGIIARIIEDGAHEDTPLKGTKQLNFFLANNQLFSRG
jgi:hypothetical protein